MPSITYTDKVDGDSVTAADMNEIKHHTHDGVYATASHSHPISEVADLQTTLDGKSATGHNHDATYAALSHTHTIANVTSLQTSLDAKVGGTGVTRIEKVANEAAYDAIAASPPGDFATTLYVW